MKFFHNKTKQRECDIHCELALQDKEKKKKIYTKFKMKQMNTIRQNISRFFFGLWYTLK